MFPTILSRLFAFRFSLSFARTQLARYRWFCVEAAPLSLLVGVLIHSGRRFLSLSLFLSFLSLSSILIVFSFSKFLYVAGRSLPALGRLVAAPLSANTAMRAGLCRDARAAHAGNRSHSFLRPRDTCSPCALSDSFSSVFSLSCSWNPNWLVS